jgi:PEP-CTERM motif
MLKHKLMFGAAVLLTAVSVAGSAYANVATGSIWENDSTGAGDATPANVPGTTPDVTFEVTTPINFSSGNLYTIGEFLSSGGATVLTGASELGNTLDNTIFNFTGNVSVTHGQTFTVGHDDGLTLVIGALTVIDEPSPTSFVTTVETYTGPTGTLPFQLVYGECCGAPADLSISLPLNGATPEPSTWVMLMLGFGGLGFAGYWRSRKAVLGAA